MVVSRHPHALEALHLCQIMIWEAKVDVANIDKQNRKNNMLYWTVALNKYCSLHPFEFLNMFLNPLQKALN